MQIKMLISQTLELNIDRWSILITIFLYLDMKRISWIKPFWMIHFCFLVQVFFFIFIKSDYLFQKKANSLSANSIFPSQNNFLRHQLLICILRINIAFKCFKNWSKLCSVGKSLVINLNHNDEWQNQEWADKS